MHDGVILPLLPESFEVMDIDSGHPEEITGHSDEMQTDATLLDITCCVRLHNLLHVIAQSLKPVKLFCQQLPTLLLFRDRRSVAQQCWIRLHSSSNIVGATHAYYAWFTKTYGLYPSHDALQVPTLSGVVASVCTPLPTRTQPKRIWKKKSQMEGKGCWVRGALTVTMTTGWVQGMLFSRLTRLIVVIGSWINFRLSSCCSITQYIVVFTVMWSRSRPASNMI